MSQSGDWSNWFRRRSAKSPEEQLDEMRLALSHALVDGLQMLATLTELLGRWVNQERLSRSARTELGRLQTQIEWLQHQTELHREGLKELPSWQEWAKPIAYYLHEWPLLDHRFEAWAQCPGVKPQRIWDRDAAVEGREEFDLLRNQIFTIMVWVNQLKAQILELFAVLEIPSDMIEEPEDEEAARPF
ncbi:MAG: hypothetical protein ACM3ZQ_05770 [Bacillota bacterium]